MTNQTQNAPNKPASTTYQITIKGTLTEDWADWFNGMLVRFETDSEHASRTTITCKVRDQSELIGILNWLHNMNLALLNVKEIQKKSLEIGN